MKLGILSAAILKVVKCVLIASLFAGAFTAQALGQGIRYVNRATGSDSNTGEDSWANAYATLGKAISELNAIDSEVSEIWIAGNASAYTPDEWGSEPNPVLGWIIDAELADSDVTIRVIGGFKGNDDGEDPSERNLVAKVTTLSDDITVGSPAPDRSYHVVSILEASEAVYELDGLQITGGRAFGTVPHDVGGGIWADFVVNGLRLLNCSVFSNEATDGGGGIFASRLPLEMRYCKVDANEVIGGVDPVFWGGGGVRCSEVTAVNSRYHDNIVGGDGGLGGGLANGAAALLVNCDFEGNHVGLLSEGEEACIGGGFYSPTAGAELVNCRFFGNLARDEGGAIYDAQPVQLRSCTIASNEVLLEGGCGGVFSDGNGLSGPIVIENSIIWANTDGFDTDFERQVSLTFSSSSVAKTCIEGLDTGTFSGNTDDDPKFVNLPTGDLHLFQVFSGELSPLVDWGDDGLLPDDDADVNDSPADDGDPIPWDLDKKQRVHGGEVDVGAYEGCQADLSGDNEVGGADITAVLGSWGPCLPPCPADLNFDVVVDGEEITIVLGNWGCGAEIPDEPPEFSEEGPMSLEQAAAFLEFESVPEFIAWMSSLGPAEIAEWVGILFGEE